MINDYLSYEWDAFTQKMASHFLFSSVRALYMSDELNRCMDWRKEKSVEEVDEFLLHVLVDVAVAGEGFAAFFVAAEGADKVGSLTFL